MIKATSQEKNRKTGEENHAYTTSKSKKIKALVARHIQYYDNFIPDITIIRFGYNRSFAAKLRQALVRNDKQQYRRVIHYH